VGGKIPSEPIRKAEGLVPNLDLSKAPVHTKSVKGRNILTDPTGEEGIVLKPEPLKAPVHTKNAKGRDGPIAPIRREEGLVQILEV
jgi:hypothetical protein